MSGQKARKMRTGSSRRRVSNQNEELEADDGFHKTDSPVAQDHMAEENTASLLDLAKLDSQSGSQHLPLLEVTGNRRKLGSSRRSKGRRDVKDSIAESYHEIRQEVVENTSDKAVVNSSLLLQGTTEMESTYQSQDIAEPDLSYIQLIHSEKQREETNPENKCTEHKSTENIEILTEQNESLREESREISDNSIVKQSEELPTDGRQNEHFKVSQVIDANLFAQLHQLEDAVNNKAHEQEVKPAQIKEMHATENVDIPFGNLIDVEDEIGDTHQSELVAKSVDRVNKQEASNPDNKQDGHPTKQNNLEVLSLRNEDGHIYDSSEPKIKQSERVDTAPVQGYKGEGQAGDDMKAIAEDIVHQHTHTSDRMGKGRKMASTRKKFQDKPKQTMTDEALKEDSDNDNKDVDVEDVVCGGEISALEMSIDFKDEYNSQSTLKEMKESLPAQVTLESIKSTSHEKTSDNIDSPVVETYQLDGMTYSKPSISGWQHYPPSPLYSPPQDNSVSLGEQTNKDYQTTGKIRKMSSTHKYYGDGHEEENTEWMQEVLSQTFQEPSKTMTTEIGLEKDDHVKSTEKVSEKLIQELESGSQFTGYEEFKTMESLHSQDILFCEDDCQISDIQNISYHDDNSKTSILSVLTQEEAFVEQNTEAMSCDIKATTQEIQMKQTNEVIETVEAFTKKDLIEIREKYDKEAEDSMDVKVVSEKDEEQFADHTAQETNASHEITYIKLLPGAQDKNILTETLAAFDISHKEALEKEFSGHVSEQSEDETDVYQSQQGISDIPYQRKDNNENTHIKSRGKRKMGSTRKNLLSRRKEGGIYSKDETKEGEFNTECDMRNQETLEAELKTLVQPKCNTTDLHVVFDKGETDMTCASYISNQPFNQEENITGNMGINQMESNIQPRHEPKETVQVDQSKNTSTTDVGGFFLTTGTSAAIQMTDNEEMINNEPEATERGTADSAPRSLLGRNDNEVTEEVLKEKKEVMEILSVMETEVLQIKKAETSLNTLYNDVIKEEEQEHQEPIITCQGHEQDLGIGASDLHNIDIENDKISGMDVSIALLTEEFGSPGATSHSEDIGSPVMSGQDSDIRNSDGTVVDLCVEPSQSEDVMSTEMHITSVVVESNSCSLSQLLQMPPNSEDYINTDPSIVERRRKVGSFRATARSAEKVEKMPEEVEVSQDQGVKQDMVLKSEETSGMDEGDSGIVKSGDSGGPGEGDALTNIQELDMSEGAHSTKSELKNASQDSNRRRKMGSTRRNLRGRPKGEDLHRVNLSVLTQEEAFVEQNTEAISCDIEATRQEIQMKQTNEVIETVEAFTKKDLIEIREKYDKEAEDSMDVKVVSEKDEEQFADHTAQETNASHEITYIKLLPGAQDKDILTETLAAFDISHKEALEKEFSGHVSEQSEDETDVHQSQQGILDIPYHSNRRRKMGSSRRNLRGRPKGEDLHRKQEVDNEIAKNIEDDIMAESASSIKAKYLLQMEHRDSNSDQEREKIVEAVKEGSHFCDTYNKPMAQQSVLGIEQNPVTDGQPVETEHHLTPSHLPSKSANFQHDVLSESKVEGRRRKMGSNRKSHGHKRYGNPAEREDKIIDPGDARDTEESAIGTFEEHRAGSSGLDKSEVVTSYNHSGKPSNKSILRTGPKDVSSQGASEQVTSIQHPCPDQLVQETGKRHSLGTSKERDLRPNCYNVVMVGNSNVGKTSFMKRAQSGKFFGDFCASVGIDTCMQSMTVDGKTVVLQLWDTAGQERFHSITRQILHKAQAFLLMYDITSFQSFSDVRYWVSCIQEGAAENTIIMLLGNKSDCAKRQVNSHEAEVLAKEYNFDFMECSAATGENVIQSLDTVARTLSQKYDTKEEGMVLHKEPQQKKSSNCC